MESLNVEKKKDYRVVATCSTMPRRYDVLQKSIEGLLKQTVKVDTIYITLPKKSRRLGIEYPPLPKTITDHCKVVHLEEDYGPVTKILGGLLAEEQDPNTVIISFDDDTIFDIDFVEVILKYHDKHPNACICATGALIKIGFFPHWTIISSLKPFDLIKGFTGFNLKKHNHRCDLVFGVGGVLYTRGMFPSNKDLYNDFIHYAMEDDALFHNDDVLISAYLSSRDIDRLVFLDIPSVTLVNGNDALSSDFLKSAERTHQSIKVAKDLGLYKKIEPMTMMETPLAKGTIGILAIILLINVICIVYTYYFMKPPKELVDMVNELTYASL
jgi:hypothetical protein